MAKLVSKVYGDALFEVAVESGRLDEIWEQTRAMQTALEENPELFALMRHPKIVKEEKVKIIESIFTGEVCRTGGTFAHDCGKGSFCTDREGFGVF